MNTQPYPSQSSTASVDPSSHYLIPLAQKILSCPACRYFMAKSFSNENIGRSLQHGVWATGPRNERNLLLAFDSSPYVILIFSVNSSSRFSGYALMTSRPGESKGQKDVFSGNDGRPFPGHVFDVKWIRHHELFFRDCDHITNSLNESKPVKIGRDGQELSVDAGRQLCGLVDQLYYNARMRQQLTIEEEYVPADGASGIPSMPPSASGGAVERKDDSTRKREVPNTVVSSAKRGRVDGAPSPTPINEGSEPLPKVSSVGLAKLATLARALKTSSAAGGGVGDCGAEPEGTTERTNDDAGEIAKFVIREAVKDNPALGIYPMDLTHMTYEDYLHAHQDAVAERKRCEREGRDWTKFPIDEWLRCQAAQFGGDHAAMPLASTATAATDHREASVDEDDYSLPQQPVLSSSEEREFVFDAECLERWIAAQFGDLSEEDSKKSTSLAGDAGWDVRPSVDPASSTPDSSTKEML